MKKQHKIGEKTTHSIYIGCRVCKNPLELTDDVHRQKSRKSKMPPAALKLGNRTAFDPTPVATKCGHIFHRGCLKRLVAEKASCRIECPTCRKPVVIAQSLGVKIYYPENVESIGRKINRLNKENEALSTQVSQCRQRRIQRRRDSDDARGAVEGIRAEVKQLDDSLQEKLKAFISMEINGSKVQTLQRDLAGVKRNIAKLSLRNSTVLNKLESVMNQMGDSERKDENLRYLKQLGDRWISEELHIATSMGASKHSTTRNPNKLADVILKCASIHAEMGDFNCRQVKRGEGRTNLVSQFPAQIQDSVNTTENAFACGRKRSFLDMRKAARNPKARTTYVNAGTLTKDVHVDMAEIVLDILQHRQTSIDLARQSRHTCHSSLNKHT